MKVVNRKERWPSRLLHHVNDPRPLFRFVKATIRRPPLIPGGGGFSTTANSSSGVQVFRDSRDVDFSNANSTRHTRFARTLSQDSSDRRVRRVRLLIERFAQICRSFSHYFGAVYSRIPFTPRFPLWRSVMAYHSSFFFFKLYHGPGNPLRDSLNNSVFSWQDLRFRRHKSTHNSPS